MKSFVWKSPEGSLSEQAYETLREDIVFLRLEPGQMIYETELADKLGMSRTPVREAFKLLQSEDLIKVLPQKGVQVGLISEQKVEESRQVREWLEINAFRQVIVRWKEDAAAGGHVSSVAKRRLGGLLEEQREAIRANNAEAFLLADEAFHLLFLEQAGNRTLMSVVMKMRGQLNRPRLLMLRELDQMNGLAHEHEQLLQAVANFDEPQAVAILENHLRKLHREMPEIKKKFPDYFSKDQV